MEVARRGVHTIKYRAVIPATTSQTFAELYEEYWLLTGHWPAQSVGTNHRYSGHALDACWQTYLIEDSCIAYCLDPVKPVPPKTGVA